MALLETYGYWWYPSVVEMANICNTALDGWNQQQFVNHACYLGELCTLRHSRSCRVAFKNRVQPWTVRGRLCSVKRAMPSDSQGKMWLTYLDTSIGWQSTVKSWCAIDHGLAKSRTLLSDWAELSRFAVSWRLKDEQELYLVWKRRIVRLGDLM